MNKHLNLKTYFGFKNEYIPLIPKLDYIKTCDNKLSIINDNYNYLLKKSKQQMLLDKKMEELTKFHSFELEKKRLDKELKLKKKRKMILKKHKLLISSYNNKMLLDMILSNKKFIKYINKTEKKNIRIETNINQNINTSNCSKNKIYYLTENSKNKRKNKLYKSINIFNSHNKTINYTDNFSVKNSEKIRKYKTSKINDIYSFPTSASIFTTSIPNSDNENPKKSVLYLKKNTNNNKILNTCFDLERNGINHNYKVGRYKSALINNKNKKIKNNLKDNYATKF